MVRTGTSKYGFWLAGYYEDWLGSRVIADDSNQPSTDGAYDANKTHHGNLLNGEAFLNPRYRWCVRDRANNSEFSSSSNYLLTNDGIARWATFDSNRLSKGKRWVARSQLQYPNSITNANRTRYDKAGVASTDDSYMLISSSVDSSSHYYIPTGDTDSTFGRKDKYEWNGRNWFAGQAGRVSSGTLPSFMQHAHLTGVWMGERIQMGAYDSSGVGTTHENTPEAIFTPIKSPSKNPFLCITTYLADDSAHQVDNVTPSGNYRPVIAYSAPLNSKSDGDFFTLRLSVNALMGYASPVIDENTNTDGEVDYVIKVGFPSSTTFGTTGSNGGTSAIEWTFSPHDGTGLSGVISKYHMLWVGGAKVGNESDDVWFDLDFKLDYTNNKFKVYHDGTEVTATNPTGGAYSSGYTMNNNTDTSTAFLPSELTGWEMFVTPNSATYNNCIAVTMIDRVALYRPLTDLPDGTSLPAPVQGWACSMPVNGVSSASIKIHDDDTEQNLTAWFLNDDITDWRLLMFSGNIDRPLWNGIIEKVNISQRASDRTRDIDISARDSLSLLDRQISSWEIGQVGLGSSDQVLARKNEIATLSESMFLGASKLESSLPTLGYESDTGYVELEGQRTRLNTAHPIQMYNNEDSEGANNVENEWMGYWIKGVNETTGSATEVILAYTGTSYTTLDTPDLYGFADHNKNAVTIAGISTNPFGVATGEQVLEITGLTYTPNAIGTLTGKRSTYPRTGASSGYMIFEFSQKPQRSNGTFLEVGDVITIPESAVSNPSNPSAGFYTVASMESYNSKFYVKTNVTSSTATVTGLTCDYTIEKGYISDTTENLLYRDQHAVWMRQLPKSAWFKKQFGVYAYNFADAGYAQSSFTANATRIEVSSSFISDSPSHGVGQVINSDGFIDTFTYNGYISPADDGNHYLVGINGLSIDHDSGEAVYTLDTSDDYKHVWLHWADMRNNADADADGGFKKNTFGLMKPVKENYEISLAFTDQFNDDGSYDEFTDLKIGQDLDIWEINAENDPSTNAPFSIPLGDGETIQLINGYSGYCVGDSGGKAQFKLLASDSGVSDIVANSKVILFNTENYNGVHDVVFVTGTTIKTITTDTDFTVSEPYTTAGQFVKKADDENREAVLRGWESKGGAFLVYDCSKFFNLNTFINKGTFGQYSGGRVNIGEYETEYHGFPVLMDSYWREATSTTSNNDAPYAYHKNFRKWVGATAELNRKIILGDTVIETKPSSSLISEFEENGYGKMKASRNVNGQNPSFDVFWYVYDGKLDTGVLETATSNTTSGTSPFVITCSGADFVNDGVTVGMRVRNVTRKWVAQITAVTATTITVNESDIYQETGSVSTEVFVSDSISIPQQLYGVYLESDLGRNLSPQDMEAYLQGILMDDVIKSNGSTAEVDLTVSGQTTTSGAFDEVIIVGSVSPRYALRFLMKTEGYVTSPNIGTYWLSDKARYVWGLNMSKTWLTQSSISCWYDIGSIPMTQSMTTNGTDAVYDSFGSPYDARGGKSIFSIIRESVESTGFGYENGLRIPITYQMGRDNKLEARPTYNTGEVLNRDILMVSALDADMSQHITNVRVYYNNGGSFVDYPSPTLNQSYRWQIVEVPEIAMEDEAFSVAKEEYFKAKTKSIKIKGEIMRDLTHDDKMLSQGRYGYIADPTRHSERGVTADVVINPAYPSASKAYNQQWSAMNGTLANGMCNALDGHLGIDGTDDFNRDRYGKGYVASASSASGATHGYDDSYWWWGAHSVSHAVQVVNIPSGCPLTSDTTSNDLRIWVALKDGQSGTDIDNAQFTIGISDVSFDETTTPFTNYSGFPSTYSPTLEATADSYATKDVKRNGFYEIDVPSTYWTSAPSGAKITLSVNVEYLKDLLYHRCGDPSGAGILHNAHDITELGVSAWSNTNADSLFPLGARKYDDMSGLMGIRNVWYCPRIHIVEDMRWRPATTVTFTDSGLGLNAEPMVIQQIDWAVSGRDIEQVSLTLERDQTKSKGGLGAYLYPSVARGRGQTASSGTVGGNNNRSSPKPPSPPVSGGGGATGTSPVTPPPFEGGRSGGLGSGFTNTFNSNMFTTATSSNFAGRMNFGDFGLSSSGFGILGQTKTPPPMNTQRAIDGIGDNIQASSSTATVSSEGMVFSGVTDPDSSSQYTQTHTVHMKVPDDVSDEIFSINGVYSLGGDGTTVAVLYATIECVETGASVTRTITVSDNRERQTLPILSSTALSGASVGNNTIKITLKRTPTSTEDTADYSSLIIHNLNVNFQRFSIKGFSSANLGFKPY